MVPFDDETVARILPPPSASVDNLVDISTTDRRSSAPQHHRLINEVINVVGVPHAIAAIDDDAEVIMIFDGDGHRFIGSATPR